MMFLKVILFTGLMTVPLQAMDTEALTSLKAMEKVFARSEKDHTESMAAIMKDMTLNKAWEVVEKGKFTDLMRLHRGLGGKKKSLRNGGSDDRLLLQLKTSSHKANGVESARAMLNDVIYESMEKYDNAISECTAFYAKQCSEMKDCRSQIDSSNYMCAKARELVSESQSRIHQGEEDIPATKGKLKDHEHTSKEHIRTMNAQLATLKGDIEILDKILDMTSCASNVTKKPNSSTFIQKGALALLRCEDACTKESFIAFNHEEVQAKLDKLQSSASRKLLEDSFRAELGASSTSKSERSASLHTDEPEPRTELANPCTDENAGAPPAMRKKRANKCTLEPPFPCEKLYSRFFEIQAGLDDERQGLQKSLEDYQKYADDVKETLIQTMKDDETRKDEAATNLDKAMSDVAECSSVRRTTEERHQELDTQLKKEMEKCNQNYMDLENEMCALKKIRRELYEIKSGGQKTNFSANFQDCAVGPWREQSSCSKECDGGTQTFEREVEDGTNGGAKCLPLTLKRSCNLGACPVDCELSEWGGWSKCTAECGGGTQSRQKLVNVAPKHGGMECGDMLHSRACNDHSCSRDCVLSQWTKWSSCSKDCGGGTNRRERFVLQPAEGNGKCDGKWSKERLQYKECHTHTCPKLTCKAPLDVVLVLDGSGSMGTEGWNAQMNASQQLVDAFNVPDTQVKMSTILFSGPFNRWKVWGCLYGHISYYAKYYGKPDMERDCKVKRVVSLEDKVKSSNMTAVKESLSNLQYPGGNTITSLALSVARSEVNMGRPDAQSVVIVMTDGKPLFWWRTWWQSWQLRRVARVVWVPVVKYAPLRLFKWLATRRWQENVVKADNFEDLASPHIANDIIADICPHHLEKR